MPWGGKASQRFASELCPSARNHDPLEPIGNNGKNSTRILHYAPY